MGQHYWMMSPAEQAALVFFLEHLRPKVAIEIGTRFGGSLQILRDSATGFTHSISIQRCPSISMGGSPTSSTWSGRQCRRSLP